MTGMSELPESCISAVISFTSPRDACLLACVSTTFRSAAESDAIWDLFLPPEYLRAISCSPSSSFSASSKKDLYIRACHHPLLINEGKLSFWLDMPTGKKCYMISSRELKITWGNIPAYWSWISLPEARFQKVAELVKVCWFDIHCEFSTSLLSPMTTYVAYLVFKRTAEFIIGFHDIPVEVTVGLGGSDVKKRSVYLDTREEEPEQQQGAPKRLKGRQGEYGGCRPEKRGDGWLESELGEFFYGGDGDGDLYVTILETRRWKWKHGLILQGIEIRPKRGGG